MDSLNKDERIAEARRRAEETSEERAAERTATDAQRIDKIRELSTEGAASTAAGINFDPTIKALGPLATPHEWTVAVDAARQVTIDAARRGETITYGELRVAAYEATGMKLGHSSFASLAMESNRKSDECLLSSIIVRASTGTPGDGFLPYARSQGFDRTVTSIQQQVFDHFTELQA